MAKVVALEEQTQPLRALSAAELQTYDEQGFVILDNVFSPADVTALNNEIERLMPEHGDTTANRPGWILQIGLRSELISSFARDERILSLIEDIVRPGIAVHSAKLVTKVPHSDIICHWHQDEAFYTKPDDPKTHSKTRMSIWVPLQDATEANGCMWVVPGSHRWGLQDYEIVDYGACIRKLSPEEYANEHAIPVPLPAGSMLLFHGMLWHHSKGNSTDHARYAFIVSYQEASVLSETAQWKLIRPAPASNGE